MNMSCTPSLWPLHDSCGDGTVITAKTPISAVLTVPERAQVPSPAWISTFLAVRFKAWMRRLYRLDQRQPPTGEPADQKDQQP